MIDLGHNEPNPVQKEQHEPMPLEGKTVLVNAAARGVGHFAVQLAKWKGAHVIAVASGENEAFLHELGADEFIDYTKRKPEGVVRDVDLVIDAVDGPTAERFLRTIKRGGALFPIFPLGFAGGVEAEKLGDCVGHAGALKWAAARPSRAFTRRRHGSCRNRQHLFASRCPRRARKGCWGHTQDKLVLTVL